MITESSRKVTSKFRSLKAREITARFSFILWSKSSCMSFVMYIEHHSNVERRKIDSQGNSLVQNHLEMCGHRNPRFSESGAFLPP